MFESVGLEPPPPPQKRKLFQPSSNGGNVLRLLKQNVPPKLNSDVLGKKNIDKDIDKVLKDIEKLGTTKNFQ
jgi:hypothetical protein